MVSNNILVYDVLSRTGPDHGSCIRARVYRRFNYTIRLFVKIRLDRCAVTFSKVYNNIINAVVLFCGRNTRTINYLLRRVWRTHGGIIIVRPDDYIYAPPIQHFY